MLNMELLRIKDLTDVFRYLVCVIWFATMVSSSVHIFNSCDRFSCVKQWVWDHVLQLHKRTRI